jgi:hypothetical protein
MLGHRGAPIYRDTRLRGHMCALRSHGLAVSRDAIWASAVLREAAIRFLQWCVGATRLCRNYISKQMLFLGDML